MFDLIHQLREKRAVLMIHINMQDTLLPKRIDVVKDADYDQNKKWQEKRSKKRHSFFPQLILEFLFSFQNKTSLFLIS